MNGDNLVDLVGIDVRTYTAFLTTRSLGINSFNCSDVYTRPYASSDSSAKNKVRLAADMNGDGLLDLVAFDNMGVYVGLNDGTGNTLTPTFWTTSLKSPGSSDVRFVGDMNGDQMPDLVAFDSSPLGGGNIAKIQFNLNRKLKLIRMTDSYGNQKSVTYSTWAVEARKPNRLRE